MSTPDEMGLTPEAARGYEEFFVPAIFHRWPAKIIAAAKIRPGDVVLDVGCGTGALTREVIQAVDSATDVTGFDLSDSMLGVASDTCPGATFQQGNVMSLPFDDDSFDTVVSAFMLMFVPDPTKALTEIRRVLRPNGRITLSVWQGLTDNPVYDALVDATRDVIGQQSAEAMAWPFTMGERGRLEGLFRAAGISEVRVTDHKGVAEFPSVESLVNTEVQAWLLADRVSADQIAEITAGLRRRYPDFGNRQGPVRFPLNAIIATTASA